MEIHSNSPKLYYGFNFLKEVELRSLSWNVTAQWQKLAIQTISEKLVLWKYLKHEFYNYNIWCFL